MNRRTIRIAFADYKRPFDPERNFVLDILRRRYDVEVCDNPDFLVDMGLGHSYIHYNCVKLLISGENSHPDFNFFDYAVGSDQMVFLDRYFRFPHFATYPEFRSMKDVNELSDEELLARDFCSFVVSRGTGHHGDPMRELFFHELSRYKKVASGGKYLNNTGCPVPDKLAFCRRYKFHIAFENSSSPGYTTEKLMQAFAADTVPIYYGNPTVGDDFRLDGLVLVRDRSDVERAIEEIVALDNDDAAYLAKCRAPRLVHSPDWYFDGFESFLYSIFDRAPEEARRLCPYGHISNHRKHVRKLYAYMGMVKAPERFLRSVRNIIAKPRDKAKTRA